MKSKNITMDDIAKELGITKVTVSRAINNKEGVSADLKREILSVANRMGYRYNSLANAFKTGQTGNIGVIAPNLLLEKDENFYIRLFKNIEEYASLRKIGVVLSIIYKHDEKQLIPPFILEQHKVDGIVVLGQMSPEYIKMLTSFEIPIVLIDFNYKEIGLDCVLTNNFDAAYEATNYLLENGHTNIGFLGNIKNTTSIRDRFFGFNKALVENNIVYDEKYTILDRNDSNELIDIELPNELPTAYLCNNDHAAFYLVKKLTKAGYQVPDDISVVGFDDVFYSSLSDPKLTTVKVKRKDLATAALNCLIKRINGDYSEIKKIIINTELVLRDSVKQL